MINLQISNFKKSIIELINKEGLPIEVKRMVVYEIYNEIKMTSDMQIAREEAENGENLHQNQLGKQPEHGDTN